MACTLSLTVHTNARWYEMLGGNTQGGENNDDGGRTFFAARFGVLCIS